MVKRITVMMDDDLMTKLRKIQAESIQKESRSVSFSEVIETVLAKGLKK